MLNKNIIIIITIIIIAIETNRPQQSFCHAFFGVLSALPSSLVAEATSRASYDTPAQTHSASYRTDRPLLHEKLAKSSPNITGTCGTLVTTTTIFNIIIVMSQT